MFASLELFEHNPGIAQTSEVPQGWGLPELPFLPGAGHVPEMCLCSKVTPWPWPGDTSWRQFFPQTGGEISLYPDCPFHRQQFHLDNISHLQNPLQP